MRRWLVGVAIAATGLTMPFPPAGAAVDAAVDHFHVIVAYTFITGDTDCKGTELCRAAPTEVITRGDTLTFTNADSVVTFHTVESDVAGQFGTDLIGFGAHDTATISTSSLPPGEYGYHCALHPNMHASFTVVASRT